MTPAKRKRRATQPTRTEETCRNRNDACLSESMFMSEFAIVLIRGLELALRRLRTAIGWGCRW